LHLPPLRNRKADIPELVGFFIRQIRPQLGVNVKEITPRALKVLMDYNWPGNIRELRNTIERALMFCDGEMIDLEHLPADIIKPT
jgi:DNA-binding NtrC family response regulator